jgi:hypothetical protein
MLFSHHCLDKTFKVKGVSVRFVGKKLKNAILGHSMVVLVIIIGTLTFEAICQG